MHVVLVLTSLLLIVAGGQAALGVLHRVKNWRQRRLLQLLVLTAPTVSLGVGILGLYHFAGRICFLSAPPWDYTLSIAGPVVMGLVTLGAVGLGVLRLGLMSWGMTRGRVTADPALQALTGHLADRLGTARPRVLLRASDRPIAITWGLRRPTLLLSTWMVECLDPRELESVLAHELGHTARHDYPVLWLATVLRDAFFYLPTSRRAYRQLQVDKELACDDLAVSVTRHPLALASALAKVWHHALGGPVLGMAQAFTEAGQWIEQRIKRLVEDQTPDDITRVESRPRGGAFGIGTAALVGLMTVQAAALIVMVLNPMACHPAALFWKVF
jgi:Zn-dependent protease with chaperone function